MNSADSFSASYQEARGKFLSAATEAGGALDTVAHPEPGPDGGMLATDVAWFGPRDAESVLVLISGTHGIEGFCGSGAQVDWLRRGGMRERPKDVAVMMVHAINPYGFAWLRRVTQENVDLNRNWVDFSQPLPSNPHYGELADALCPSDWSPKTQAASAQTMRAFVEAKGEKALQQAVSGGQHTHPQGIFYGGVAPTWSRQTQTALFAHYLGNAGRIGIIDYHTGLGPWGYAERIVLDPVGSPGFDRARQWYGAAITSPSGGSSTSADIVGDGLSAARTLLAHAEVTGMALEVGTLDSRTVINTLRADAWLHAYGDLQSELGRAIKAEIRNAFYGDQDDWKGMVAGQSLTVIKQALAELAI